ncbi:MAG TPA: hypothetical protein VMY59_04710 [Candidatus Thermoplasmatota archaeon]|nr:hypothetical protein [Candidatus Thermoplasmatota archaeon]HUU87542.1 hypothetical protein [Candidatus Glassbacteria bacterium]
MNKEDIIGALEYLEDCIKENGDSITISILPIDEGGNYTVRVLDGSDNVIHQGHDDVHEAHEVLAEAIDKAVFDGHGKGKYW